MSERVYKLLDGSELLVSEEVMGVRQTPEGMPITVDGDYVINDVLALVDRLHKELEEAHVYRKSLVKTMFEVDEILRWHGPSGWAPARSKIMGWLESSGHRGQEGAGKHE